MRGKVCIITGANSGIGRATAVELARRGARVVMVCRSPERGERAQAEIRAAAGSELVDLHIGDLASLASVRAVAAELRGSCDRLDVLVNNAGLYIAERQLSADGYEATMAINHLGHFELVRQLQDLLIADGGARVVNVSSAGHHLGSINFDDLQTEGRYWGLKVYCDWKLGNVLFTRGLAARLRGQGVTANSLHPGAVRSNFAQQGNDWFGGLVKLGRRLLISPESGAKTSVYLASSPEVAGVSGEYFQRSRRSKASRRGRSDADAGRLWEASEELVSRALG